MDTFSHALWGGGLYGYRGYFWFAVFVGAFPDLMSFGILFASEIINGTFIPGPPPLNTIPDWGLDKFHSFIRRAKPYSIQQGETDGTEIASLIAVTPVLSQNERNK